MDKFRFTKAKALFTYKYHLNKEALKEFFNNMQEIKEFLAAHEKGNDKETPYDHTHVYVEWNKRFDTKNSRTFDFQHNNEQIHPNIKSIGRTKKDKENVINYLCKEDEENKHLQKNTKKIAEKVWECKTLQEAASLAENASEIGGIIQLFNMKTLKSDETLSPNEHLHHKWQHTLWKEIFEIEKKWDKRSIRWIIGTQGGEGKSRFIEVLKSNARSKVLVMTQFAGQSNSAEILNTALGKGWSGEILAVDLPRDAETHQIYEPLEAILNGTITATKYKGTEISLPKKPKVFIMANFEPNQSKMSADRWNIGEISTTNYGLLLTDRINTERTSRMKKEKLEKRNNWNWETEQDTCATNNITSVAQEETTLVSAISAVSTEKIYSLNAGTPTVEPPEKRQRLSIQDIIDQANEQNWDDETLNEMLNYLE